ncbi:uroporphyrin-III C-methyltransferase [Mycetocola sp. CAN_C7]|uniref:uroporphyrinogen-III C-methyltransferase n=1 Tax=Mycetocola sp. CAN_C7 TaxID=2787724 RepID=UPI0018CA81CF
MTDAGTVALVGGGPGDESLLTAAALAALGRADVVLYDRLAPHHRLSELAPNATLIDVGKRPGHHPIGQGGIEAQIVAHALGGSNVVRFKGGDPYVFGRGSEEVLACHREGIPVKVIPGVTSAVAVPASAGIPLTHRGVSHMFTVVSGHAPLTDAEHRHLAGLGGTIVVLMGVGTLATLTQGLLREGLAPDTPVAIIERGFSEKQRTTIADLSSVVHVAAQVEVRSPAVLVIGRVVDLAFDGHLDAAALMDRASRLAAFQ